MIENYNKLDSSVIIEDMIASEPMLDAQAVSRWIVLYPQYEREIMNFAAQLSLLTHLPPDSSPLEDESGYYARGLETVAKVIEAKRKTSSQTQAPLASILTEAEKLGLPIANLATVTKLSIPIIAKFEQRLISFSSIPREALETLASTLNRSVESVSTYLQAGAGFAPGASYKSETSPEMPQQQDFFAAVRSDRTMSEEKKTEWLALASRPRDSQ